MAYLPIALVRQNFQLMGSSNTVHRLIRRLSAVAVLIRYFNQNYITGLFQPHMWNVYHRDSTTRNHVDDINAVYLL
jgi:hypothetical protein